MRRLPIALAAMIAITTAGCSPERDVDTARTQTSAAASQASPTDETTPLPTQEPTVSPTASPTTEPTPEPAEALAPEITDFSTAGGSLSVRIHNPNENLGLARVGFEMTAIAADGSIAGVFGGDSLAGAPAGTIYQLPPEGDFGLDIPIDPSSPDIAELELVITDEWIEWDSVDAPQVELTNVSMIESDFGGPPRVTGRVAVPRADEGPFNVWIVAFISSGSGLVVATGAVDCVKTPEARAFDIQSFAFETEGPYELQDVVAYTTTIPGVTEDAPDNC